MAGWRSRRARSTHRAKACVLALGVNQMQAIRFAPELGASKREAIALGHGGRSFKLWIRAEGVEPARW